VPEVHDTIASQGPRHTKDVIKTLTREILALSQELTWDKSVMDTIWNRNPSKS